MASLEKGKPERSSKSRPGTSKVKKPATGIPDIENPEQEEETRPSVKQSSLPGSVISVKDAEETAKTETVQDDKVAESKDPSAKGRPPSGKPPPAPAGPSTAFVATSAKPQAEEATTTPPSQTDAPAAQLPRPASSVSLKSMGKKNTVEPVNVPGSNMGSAVSLQSRASREAWSGGDSKPNESQSRPSSATKPQSRPSSAQDRPASAAQSRPPSALAKQSRPTSAATSVISVNEASSKNRVGEEITKEQKPVEIVPPDMNEAHAYIPYTYARDCIAKMMEDMKKMKRKHITIITDIEENYQHIEQETQKQFNSFVIGLRHQYGSKVKTFRQVIEVHRTELQQKQQHWDEALTSLSNKNKQLLQDKKNLLIQNKLDGENMEKEKEDGLRDLVTQLDERNKAFVIFEKEKEEEARKTVVEKERDTEELKKSMEQEQQEFKEHCEEEVVKLQGENKILQDELDNEKGERIRLEAIIDDLKKRPDTSAAVTAAVGFRKRTKTPIEEKREEKLQSAVVVTDMSEEERKKMEEERKQMEEEREEMKRDRERMEKDREDFVSERNHFQEERVIIHGELATEKKDKEVLKIKYDDLKASLDNNDDWKKRYETLLAQYEAVTSVAQVNTKEEKAKAEEEIEKADKDKTVMEEEKQKLEEEIKKWEKDFKQQTGRPPAEEDRNDSTQELYASLEEANNMVGKLEAQVVALEAIKRGEIPPPPKVEKETITIKETEVKTVEIKVPDPELLAYVEMTQAELEAMKRQLTALKNDKTELKSENSKLQADISHLQGQIGKVEATNKELEERLRQAVAEMEALKNQLKQADVEPVQTSADQGDIPVVKVTQIPETVAAPPPPPEPVKPDVETQNKQTQTEVKTKPVNKASQTDALPVSATPKTEEVEPGMVAVPPVPVVDREEVEALEKQLRDKDKEIRELELAHKEAIRSLEKEKNSLEKDIKKCLKALAKAQKEGPSKEDKKLRNLLDIVVAQVREINGQAPKAAQEVDKRLKNAESVQKKSSGMQEKAKQQFSEWELGWAEENGKEPVLEDVQADKGAHKMYKVLKAANKKVDEDEMLVEALTLIKTGSLPEKQDKEIPEKETSLAMAAKPAETIAPCNHEEEIEKLEETVSEQEKRIDELEDQVRDLEKQRDLLNNENQDLEDRISDLLAEIEKLKGQVEFHKNKAQELYKQMEEQRLQHEQDLRDKDREHERVMQEKEEEFQKERTEMEKDIRKLVKLIDKLKKKMQQKVRDAKQPQSELEALLDEKDAELDELDERVNELEDQLADLDSDKQQLIQANKRLEDMIGELETVVTKTETRVTELGVAAGAASASEEEAQRLRDDLQALRNKIKELEQELRVKNKELRELEYEHEKQMRDKEREAKEMKADIEKLVKVMDKLQKKIKEDKKEIDSLQKELRELENDCREKDSEIDDLIDKLNAGEKELARRERSKPEKTKEEDYEEIITELKTKVTVMEEQADKNENKAHDWETDYKQVKEYNDELQQQVDELQEELTEAQNKMADLQMAASAAPMLDKATDDISELRAKVRSLEGDVRNSEKELKEQEITLKEKTQEHERAMREKEMLEREMKSDMKKLMKEIEKLQKKLKKREELLANSNKAPDLTVLAERDEEVAGLEKTLEKAEDKLQELEYQVADLQTDKKHLQKDVDTLEDENKKLEDKLFQLREELDQEREKMTQFDMQPITSGTVVPVAASTPTGGAQSQADVETIRELNSQIESLQKQLDQAHNDLVNEKSAHGSTKDELEQLKNKLKSLQTDLENHKHESVAALDALNNKKEAEMDNMKRKQSEQRKRIQELEQQQQKDLPPDAVKEIKQLQDKLAAFEKELDNKEVEKADLSSKVRELIAKNKSLENTSKNQKSSNSEAELKMKHLRQEKDREIKTLQVQADKKERERALQEKKKIAALEQQIRELQAGAPRGAAKEKPVPGKVDNKALKDVQDKLKEAKRENADLNTQLKVLQKNADKSSNTEADRLLKKQEKLSQELMKKLDDAQKKNKKNEENLREKENDLKQMGKENTAKEVEIAKLRAELESLGVAAKAGLEAENRRKELEKEVKKLHEENKTLSDNWNQERVLRKKYYNMVEDMKGKIRVYARVRPMSRTELNNGNKEVTKSPDEYTVQLETQRGNKEWQFDQIFMPDSTQEKVFEDTNNLVQSAVDGYNVCIFAYGQTGSGKTFTIIGDSEQRLPGIAPRAFNRIFHLLDENKVKFKYHVECYMLELYNDKLLDLFAKPGTSSDDKLEIKKDKKGMVFIQGSEVKSARNSKELFALFEEGSKTRHTASTKMNSESSRSHLVIGIIIETTNRATGQVLKGKLSLVDLAGSERAAKTGASAEQLKEAMSINKSLSALGDVISALSSEQSFIPYRNNKLTMLMQDSLGGNAKTLMFVNISPADYNADESAVSLTYASRVKLITNDAQKNADNKEIARLRNIISKLKAGDATVEEEETA